MIYAKIASRIPLHGRLDRERELTHNNIILNRVISDLYLRHSVTFPLFPWQIWRSSSTFSFIAVPCKSLKASHFPQKAVKRVQSTKFPHIFFDIFNKFPDLSHNFMAQIKILDNSLISVFADHWSPYFTLRTNV